MTWRKKLSKLVDGAYEVLAPRKAFERQAWRQAMQIRAGYEGASNDRPRTSWIGKSGSADAELLPDLHRLREHSRDLYMNDGVANSVKTAFLDNVIGSGIHPQARVDGDELGMTPDAALELNHDIERQWHLWCREASADNRTGFAELQAQALAQLIANGDFFAQPLMLQEPHRRFSLAIEMIEADRVDDPIGLSGDQAYKPAVTRGGVELGDRGQPLAYWISERHPGDVGMIGYSPGSRRFRRIEAWNNFGRPNVLHVFAQERPGQSRGVPLLAPVLNYFKDLKDYKEAELISTKVAACFTAFVTKAGDPGSAARARATGGLEGGQREQEIGPGAIMYLKDGETVQTATPGRPNIAFAGFVDRVLLDLGSSIGLPYELLSRDFRKTNYSSARAALLEARRTFARWQSFFRARFLQPIYEMFVEELYLRGTVQMPDYYANRDALCRTQWIAPAWGMIDPDKEIASYKAAVDANFMTQAEVCAALSGTDWEEKAEQRAREQRRFEELDIVPPITGVGSAPANSSDSADPAGPADPTEPTDSEEPNGT